MVPGVFSGDGLDQGTAFLVEYLTRVPTANRVLDLGCGAGHLGIAALRRWPTCRALFLDADARAVACATVNCARLGLADRAEIRWWCERDDPPAAASCDLVLVNPPCHAGSELDIFLAEALLDIAGRALAPGGRLLVVANRRLPYEPMLARFGTLAPVQERDAFKVIEVLHG
jgi:16S rRNA (guanine1207-N2)-methyltransferase